CSNGSCVGGPSPNCDDGNACTADSCSTICPTAVTCVHTSIVCDDHNTCTDDSCNASSGCVFTPNNANPCDDGNPCTTDSCIGGTCVGGPSTLPPVNDTLLVT